MMTSGMGQDISYDNEEGDGKKFMVKKQGYSKQYMSIVRDRKERVITIQATNIYVNKITPCAST